MTKRPAAWCDRCEATVYADDLHTCTPANALRVADAERAVVEAAEAYVHAASIRPFDEVLRAQVVMQQAVHALWRVREEA